MTITVPIKQYHGLTITSMTGGRMVGMGLGVCRDPRAIVTGIWNHELQRNFQSVER